MEALTQRAESADKEDAADGMGIPAEIAEAKARIEARAEERDGVEQAAYQEKVARREAQRKTGKKPRERDPEPPHGGPRDKDQVNLTDPQSLIMPVTGKGFDQCYNAQDAVDTETMLVTHVHVTQATLTLLLPPSRGQETTQDKIVEDVSGGPTAGSLALRKNQRGDATSAIYDP